MNNKLPYFTLIILWFWISNAIPGKGLPLSTNSRWIVDENGNRVKLACVNWGAHLQPMTTEGLHRQPLDVITKKIVSMGFNCVRFTWPTYLMTNDSMANVTVRSSFKRIGAEMDDAIAGIQAFNPSIIDLPIIEAFKAVLANLQQNNVMVILDNHLTVPGWCCSSSDGNGFFGDEFFDPNVWIEGWSRMATLSKNFSNVVGMSLRNELRGPKQNASVWYREMQRGAETVHAINPNALVILSGLKYDKTFSFLHDKWLNISFTRKLVFEVHHYGVTDGQNWKNNSPDEMCARTLNSMKWDSLFLIDKGYPLFFSEFGAPEAGDNINDNRFMNCFLSMLAEYDLDWNLWTLFGSYYIRQGTVDLEESYGLLNRNWSDIRNTSFLQRIQAIQPPFRGPGQTNQTHKMIFHPLTGYCIKSSNNTLQLSPCNKTDGWNYTNHTITLTNQQKLNCIQAFGEGKPVTLSQDCGSGIQGSSWNTTSRTKMQLSTNIGSKNTIQTVCLDIDSSNTIVSNKCKCVGKGSPSCDPASQWFKLVDSNRGN
ncbi:hypothetical protein ACFE04_024719 [Oxalis oulophora]